MWKLRGLDKFPGLAKSNHAIRPHVRPGIKNMHRNQSADPFADDTRVVRFALERWPIPGPMHCECQCFGNWLRLAFAMFATPLLTHVMGLMQLPI